MPWQTVRNQEKFVKHFGISFKWCELIVNGLQIRCKFLKKLVFDYFLLLNEILDVCLHIYAIDFWDIRNGDPKIILCDNFPLRGQTSSQKNFFYRLVKYSVSLLRGNTYPILTHSPTQPAEFKSDLRRFLNEESHVNVRHKFYPCGCKLFENRRKFVLSTPSRGIPRWKNKALLNSLLFLLLYFLILFWMFYSNHFAARFFMRNLIIFGFFKKNSFRQTKSFLVIQSHFWCFH